MRRDEILKEITDFYIHSPGFNGVPYKVIKDKYHMLEENALKDALVDLIREGKVTINYNVNPHIKQYQDFPAAQQISVLRGNSIREICLYPTEKHLAGVLDPAKYREQPFTRMLYLGRPQLEPLYFNLAVLREYASEPGCRVVHTTDYAGAVVYNIKDSCGQDKTLLPIFRLGYTRESGERVVAAYLRHLKNLAPNHQQKWHAYLMAGVACDTIEDQEQNAVYGQWAEKVSIYAAFVEELYHINQMSFRVFGEKMFQQDFKKSRPEHFRPLLVPTAGQYHEFLRALNGMLAGNLNAAFLLPEQSAGESAGQAHPPDDASKIQLLDAWLRQRVRLPDCEAYDFIIQPFAQVHGLVQEQLHNPGEYNKEYINQQNKLMTEVYDAVNTIRELFAQHPLVKGYKMPDWLNKENLII